MRPTVWFRCLPSGSKTSVQKLCLQILISIMYFGTRCARTLTVTMDVIREMGKLRFGIDSNMPFDEWRTNAAADMGRVKK
jgi:hypothetical protein